MKTQVLISIVLLSILSSCEQFNGNDTPDVSDIEGNTYSTVQIGNQIWFAENSKTKYDKDGNQITRYSYLGIEDKVEEFGGLYTYETAQLVCPEGWHLPSLDDWKVLERSLGVYQEITDLIGWRGEHAALLKEGGESGFNALYSGYKDGIVNFEGQYYDMGVFAGFWLNTQVDEVNSFVVFLNVNSERVGIIAYDLTSAFSVRCVQDN